MFKMFFCVLILFLGIIFFLNTGSGLVNIIDFIDAIWVLIFNGNLSNDQQFAYSVLINIRLPRICIAMICGASLSVAGVLSQGFFRNSLASPELLGTASGAGFAAALSFYFGLAYSYWFCLPISAFIGAACATMLIMVLASRREFQRIEHLLLVGMALNAFLGSLTSLVVSLTLENHHKIPSLMYWFFGSLNSKDWNHVLMGIIPLVLILPFAYRLCPKLNVLSLGEETARTLSLSITKLRTCVIACVAILVGISVSVAGAITFVGLIVPHITRLLFGPEHKKLFIFSLINGMSLLLYADILSRSIRPYQEIQVGIIIAILGALFFFILLLKRDSSR